MLYIWYRLLNGYAVHKCERQYSVTPNKISTLLMNATKTLIVLLLWNSLGCSCTKKPNPEPEPTNGNGDTTLTFIHGADLSYVNQVEDKGGVYREEGNPADPYQLLSNRGVKMARFRLWHNPMWVKDIYGESAVLYSGIDDVERSIQRAKGAGMAILLNFHYSDVWADPGHQDVPGAWRDITSIDVLCDSVRGYTYRVLERLWAKNLLPDMVQIGNETNCGMMFTNTQSGFPPMDVCKGNWANFGRVVNAAIAAVRDIDAKAGTRTLVGLHVADPKNLDWWTGDVISKGKVSDFDVIGFSYYHIWHTDVPFNNLSNHVKQVRTKHGKDVMVLETAYPFTTANNDSYPNIHYTQPPLHGFPYTPQGQKDFMIALTQSMMDAGASGVFYWEPAWITSNLQDLWGKGSSWENCTFFNFNGNITGVVDYLKHDYRVGGSK